MSQYSTNVWLNSHKEPTPPGWLAVWVCLNPSTHSGYRAQIQHDATEEVWHIKIERVTAGVGAVLGEGTKPISESEKEGVFGILELRAWNGKISVTGSTIGEIPDATYTGGYSAIEALGFTGALREFHANGYTHPGTALWLLWAENESPLSAEGKFTALPWAKDAGECAALAGWSGKKAEEISGAYWNTVMPSEEEREAAEKKEQEEKEEKEKEEEEEAGGSPVTSIAIRERPSSKLAVLVATPSGFRQRWGEDDPNPVFSPTHMTLGSAMPGGFDRFSCILQRDPGLLYPDLEVLSDVRVEGNGGTVAFQGRLEKLPDVAGFQAQITPEAVGYQAAMEDDNTAREIYADQDRSQWTEASRSRQIEQLELTRPTVGPSLAADPTNNLPALVLAIQGPFTSPINPLGEAWYDAKGLPIHAIYYQYEPGPSAQDGGINWRDAIDLCDNDKGEGLDSSGNYNGPGSSGYVFATTPTRLFAVVQHYYEAVAGADFSYNAYYPQLVVYGNHGLPLYGTPGGVLASDVVAHALGTWAPEIDFTTGTEGTIVPSVYVIGQLAFTDSTTVAEILKQATRFELQDWAVWEGPKFYMNARGARARQWKARVGPGQLQETGPQTSRLWNGVAVQYQDVVGQTRTVGPPGFRGGTPATEDPALLDADPENPLNQKGERKWALLKMGVSTPGGAKTVGRKFLQEQARLNTSGQASIVGYVEDTAGAFWPAWTIRAGDEISFVDSSSTGPRRIVSVSYDHGARTAALQLDQPPEQMQALLERLSVSLVGLGVT